MTLLKGKFILLSLVLLPFYAKGEIIKKGKDHAVFFAVENYDHWDDLNTPINDAIAIASALEEEYNFTTEVIKNPTWLDVMDRITALQNQHFNSEDQLLLFFSGHGEFIPSSTNPKKGQGYFIPRDARKNDKHNQSYLYYPNIKPEIDQIPCEHVLMVIDACYSGSFLQYRSSEDERPGVMSQRDKLINTFSKKRCRKAISSGGLKRTRDGLHHSPFTERFLNTLNSKGGDDRVLTYNELFTGLEGLSPEPHRGYFAEEDSDSKFLFIAKTQSNTRINNTQTTNQQTELNNQNEEEKDWSVALSWDNKSTYRGFLDKYPFGKYSAQAKEKLKEKSVKKCSAYAQSTSIKGEVTNKNGRALNSTKIHIKGTSLNIVTDIDGSFSIPSSLELPLTLVVSYRTYKTKEVQIRKNSFVTITLEKIQKKYGKSSKCDHRKH